MAVGYSWLGKARNKTVPVSSPAATDRIEPTNDLPTSPPGTARPTSPPSQTPVFSVKVLHEGPALYPSLNSDDKTIYFFDHNEVVIKRLSLTTGTTDIIADSSVFVTAAAWSADRRHLLLRVINGQGNREDNIFFQPELEYGTEITLLYRLSDGQTTKLNSSIKAMVFIGNDQIVYQYDDGSANNLSLAKPDGSRWRNIAKLSGEAKIVVSGDQIIVQSADGTTIYSKDGRPVKRLVTPDNLDLSRSSWSSGGSAVYWTEAKDPGAIELWRYNSDDNTTTLIGQVAVKTEGMAILWDNTTDTIYLSGFGGMVMVTSSAPSR